MQQQIVWGHTARSNGTSLFLAILVAVIYPRHSRPYPNSLSSICLHISCLFLELKWPTQKVARSDWSCV